MLRPFLLVALLVACKQGAPSTPPPSTPSPPPTGLVTCTTSADCADGEICVGPPGCEGAWTCRAGVMCTRDLRSFCSCDGRTVEGSGSCPPEPWRYEGPCRDPMTVEECGAAGGEVAWPIGPPAACPEGRRPIGPVGPAGIEGHGLCCR